MTRAWLSLGSNQDRERHITAALDALADRFGALVMSSVYDSAAVGFTGKAFLNLVVGIDTTLPVGELSAFLRALEEANGRVRNGPRFSDRTLDVDILTYGDAVGTVDGISLPRDEVLKHAFVLVPLAEVAPGENHPQAGQSYATLLAQRDFSAQPLRPVPFRWRGRELSRP